MREEIFLPLSFSGRDVQHRKKICKPNQMDSSI